MSSIKDDLLITDTATKVPFTRQGHSFILRKNNNQPLEVMIQGGELCVPLYQATNMLSVAKQQLSSSGGNFIEEQLNNLQRTFDTVEYGIIRETFLLASEHYLRDDSSLSPYQLAGLGLMDYAAGRTASELDTMVRAIDMKPPESLREIIAWYNTTSADIKEFTEGVYEQKPSMRRRAILAETTLANFDSWFPSTSQYQPLNTVESSL